MSPSSNNCIFPCFFYSPPLEDQSQWTSECEYDPRGCRVHGGRVRRGHQQGVDRENSLAHGGECSPWTRYGKHCWRWWRECSIGERSKSVPGLSYCMNGFSCSYFVEICSHFLCSSEYGTKMHEKFLVCVGLWFLFFVLIFSNGI